MDRSTRFLSAASAGQIYPELRRLESEGLVEGEDAPNGRRAPRVYRLTAAGGDALGAWLLGPDYTVELRDEALLRLFFADALPREEALHLLEAPAGQATSAYLALLRAIEGGRAAIRPSPASSCAGAWFHGMGTQLVHGSLARPGRRRRRPERPVVRLDHGARAAGLPARGVPAAGSLLRRLRLSGPGAGWRPSRRPRPC